MRNLGLALEDTGNFEEAIRTYERALASHPEDVDTLEHLSIACAMEDRWDQCVAACKKTLDLDPENRVARGCLNRAKAPGDGDGDGDTSGGETQPQLNKR